MTIMEPDINNLIQQINQLPQADKSKLLTFLMYQTSIPSDKDKETIEFLTASSKRLITWIDDSDDLMKRMDVFFDELKKSA